MSTLKIPYLNEIYHRNPEIITRRMMESGVVIPIDKINWKEFYHQPDVKVYLCFCDQWLWLHYVVQNDFVRAVCRKDQEPVWQDSCVEFFLKHGDIYRNFEFNSLGVCLSAFGSDRISRQSLDPQSLARIVRFSSLKSDNLPSAEVPANWSLTVGIPLDLIGLDAGSLFMANFYKCGDLTQEPHYLSWSPILASAPDFHRPEFFAQAELVC